MNKNFKFIPSPYEGGQITDSKPGQKFEDKFDPIFECIQKKIGNTFQQLCLKGHPS